MIFVWSLKFYHKPVRSCSILAKKKARFYVGFGVSQTPIKSTDLECFNEKFFSCIKRFDMTSNADTIFSHREDETPLKWYEYLHEKYDDTYKELEELFM